MPWTSPLVFLSERLWPVLHMAMWPRGGATAPPPVTAHGAPRCPERGAELAEVRRTGVCAAPAAAVRRYVAVAVAVLALVTTNKEVYRYVTAAVSWVLLTLTVTRE